MGKINRKRPLFKEGDVLNLRSTSRNITESFTIDKNGDGISNIDGKTWSFPRTRWMNWTGYSFLSYIKKENNKKKRTKLSGSNGRYYDLPKGSSELQDLIEHKNMNFSIGNAFKALYRLGDKEGTDIIYDLEKVIYFTKREIKRIKKC